MHSRIIDVRACEKKTYQIQPAVSGNYLIFFVLQRLDKKKCTVPQIQIPRINLLHVSTLKTFQEHGYYNYSPISFPHLLCGMNLKSMKIRDNTKLSSIILCHGAMFNL